MQSLQYNSLGGSLHQFAYIMDTASQYFVIDKNIVHDCDAKKCILAFNSPIHVQI